MERKVELFVSGYVLDDPSLDRDELQDVVDELASDIGMRLADLGRSCKHGQVTLQVAGERVESGE